MFNAIHITHEAVYKVGGIGTVLEGLINSRPYRDGVGRTVLVCPLFYPENVARFGPGGVLEYSSLDHLYDGPFASALRQVENEFGVRIAYGRRPIEDEPTARRTIVEVLLIDLRGIHRARVNATKGLLWEHFGLRSDPYEHIWDYEQYVQLAAPAVAALQALKLGTTDVPAVVFAHEFMGVPTALALQAAQPDRYRTLFYAHEVATVRRLVERHAGHDVMFYNAMKLGRKSGLYLEQVFGPQDDYFKHAVVEAARHCDGILAVGHHVVDELRFISPHFDDADITLCYNGIPASSSNQDERTRSRARLGQYLKALLGWQPDWIFTRVTRLARSKALWRDIDVLLALDERFRATGETAVLLALSTELPRRPAEQILRMEQEWDWPLAHREGEPDLTGGEAEYYRWVQSFNARARQIKIVYLNQFGFERALCGQRVPEDVTFLDLRRGTDAEFGLSLYEPFGISPLEPLTYGGICLVSTSCGCAGFVKMALGARRAGNVLLANYIDLVRRPRAVRDAVTLGAAERREVEAKLAEQLAHELNERLPREPGQRARLQQLGYDLARSMSWDVVAERFVFPAVRRACTHRRVLSVA
ncbi:MAG: hypothetical protein IPM18_01330 [Phycisphaerales bacterium]|nr:hypothetical protein [Phycisphaerales bacterium]